jgi:hypothetical protein
MERRGVFSATGFDDFKKIKVFPSHISEEDKCKFVYEVHLLEEGLWEETKNPEN